MTRAAALQALLVTAGRIAFVGFSFVGILVVYRGLGTTEDGLAQAGLFAISLACIKVVSGCVSDPIDLAVMRRTPSLLSSDPARAFEILGAAFALRMAGAATIAALLLLLAPLISVHLLGRPEAATLVRCLALAGLADVFFRAVLVVLQASERFGAFVFMEAMLHVGRFTGILAIWLGGAMRVEAVVGIYAAVALGAALVGVSLLPSGVVPGLRARWGDLVELCGYLKWMVPAMVLAALTERLDVFLVYSKAGSEAAGLYGAAVTLALIPDILAGCLSTFLQPRVARMHATGRLPDAIRRFLRISLPVCSLAFVASLALSVWLIPLLLGGKYALALPAFHWLLAGTLFWLAVTPVPMTAVAVVAPQRIVLVTVMQATLVLVGGLALLPSFGWVGMAQAVCAMRIAVALALVLAACTLSPSPVSDEAAGLRGSATP